MDWQTVYGSQPESPAEIEITPTRAYVRQNIEQVEMDGVNMWKYDELSMTIEDYKIYSAVTPVIATIAQQNNDLAATQEMADITAELNHEEQMQLLNDIWADVNSAE